MIDYHIHTKLCRHAEGEMIEYCKIAVKKGIEEIGFSDHFPVNIQPKYSIDIKKITMREEEIYLYLSNLNELKKKVKNLKIKTAFEIDYYPKENLFFNKYLSKLYNELDYIICSVHFIDDIGFDQKDSLSVIDNMGIEKVWTRYFDTVAKNVKENYSSIDIIGHFDLPKKYMPPMPDGLTDKAIEALDLIKEYGLCIELNTSGWDNPAKEQYPSEKILTYIDQKKIDMTMGSDAHSPEEVGRHFNKAVNLLKSNGFERIIKFSKHKKDYCYL